MNRLPWRLSNNSRAQDGNIMLINGFGKFAQKAGLSEVEKLTGATVGGRKNETLNQAQKTHAAKSKRKSRSRSKKG